MLVNGVDWIVIDIKKVGDRIMPSDKTKRLNEFIKKNNVKNYPIDNKLLEEETDYIKNNYFKMLALVLQQENEVADAQYSLMKRMLSGIQTDYTLEDYLRQALDIEITEYVDFTEQMKEQKVKYRFILDALLLSCCAEQNEEQLRLVTAFVEALKITKEEIQYISEVCKSILEQDSKIYWEMEKNSYSVFVREDIQSYFMEDIKDVFEVTNESIRIFFVKKKIIDIRQLCDENGLLNQKSVSLKNAVLNLAGCRLYLNECKYVEFDNCEFIDGKNSLYLDKVENAKFYDCSFKNFSARVMEQKNVGKVEINRCQFENCYYQYSKSRTENNLGGIFHAIDKNMNAINLINETKFKNCGGRNGYGYAAFEIISNCISIVNSVC